MEKSYKKIVNFLRSEFEIDDKSSSEWIMGMLIVPASKEVIDDYNISDEIKEDKTLQPTHFARILTRTQWYENTRALSLVDGSDIAILLDGDKVSFVWPEAWSDSQPDYYGGDIENGFKWLSEFDKHTEIPENGGYF